MMVHNKRFRGMQHRLFKSQSYRPVVGSRAYMYATGLTHVEGWNVD